MNIDRSRLRFKDESPGAPPLPPEPVTTRPSASPPPVVSRPYNPAAQPAPARRPAPAPLSRPTPSAAPPTLAPPAAGPPAAGPGTNISINITMPKFKKPTLPAWNYRRLGIIAAAVVGFIIFSLIVHAVIAAAIERHKEYEAKHQINMINQRKAPTFKPLVPKAASTSVAQTAAYDATRDSYSYDDTLKGMSLIVSQQRLPAGADLAQTVAKIAKSLSATTPLIAGGGTAYMAADKASGAQTVVYGKSDRLVFIQSAFTHSSDDWKAYLDNLSS